MRLTRRHLLAAAAVSGVPHRARAGVPCVVWSDVERAGRGQSVAWNAWAGDDRTNAYIAWVAERMKIRHDVKVRHVRLRDTSEAAARVAAEKASGRLEGGSVDLLWINGQDFHAMKQAGLLHGSILDVLPHAGLIDRAGKPATATDFTLPVEEFAVPWRMSQLVFVHDSARLPNPPSSMAAMLAWSALAPGRMAHPDGRSFLGATFLKQALLEFAPDPAALRLAATDENFGQATGRMWAWYAALRPTLWRGGTVFPETGRAQRNLMNDGEIDLMVSLNPSEAATSIANGTLPGTARAYVLTGGTIGHCSFNAIPFNAANKEAALLTVDFLLSPEAQAHGMDARTMGSPTVLALDRLSASDRRLFAGLPCPPGSLTDAELGKPLPEMHPSWMTRIAAEWVKQAMP